ncbi:MAG: carotenoid 1,2-hydratase [Gammaproteobacteria bacterium]|nr:carotenoid 1,2-hydratase [Gammaproteobacteria bacterium]MCP5196867.1 carotenoid 1,2-hydratase [Gammaproteobacteria bacterium]
MTGGGRRFWRWGVLLLLVGVSIALTVPLLRPRSEPAKSIAVGAALGGGDPAGYRRADRPRVFHFPDDHGPHPEFRNEWWYLTGNLVDAAGRPFGYQWTLFRIALSPEPPVADSAWRTHQVYLGHFAVTDVASKKHDAVERFSRGAVGLAGAQAQPFRVWLEDWQLSSMESDAFPMRLRVRDDDMALDLILEAGKPVVLQGDRGLSQKSAEPGNASYYYSHTRLPTQGEVELKGQVFKVTGSSWLDREWSTSALGAEQSGWDWFALQLDDGRELMFYRLRGKDGRADPFSKGVLVDAAGQTQLLRWEALDLQPLGEWISPHTGDRYPAGWRLRLPGEHLELTVMPKVADQEMRLTVHYWEGAVTVVGHAGDRKVNGQGYLEMTRYESSMSR